MKKYIAFIKFKFLASLQFRAELFVWIFLDFLPYFLLFFVFLSMYREQDTLRGLHFYQIVEYYFLASIIQGLTATHFENWRAEEIRMGKIDFFLIRPFSYLREIMMTDIAGKLFYVVLFAPLYLFFYVIVRSVFQVEVFAGIDWKIIPLFLGLLCAAYFIQLMLGTIIALLTFWFEGAEGLQHFKWISITLLSGATIPIEFMPLWLKNIVLILPFQYLYAFPIAVIQGRQHVELKNIEILAGTTLGLWVMVKILFHKAVLRYSSTGG